MGRFIRTNDLHPLRRVTKVTRTATGALMALDDEFLRVDVIRADIVRIKISAAGRFDETPTFGTSFRMPRRASFRLSVRRKDVTLTTPLMTLVIGRDPFVMDATRADGSTLFRTYRNADGVPETYQLHNNAFVLARERKKIDPIYGLGEKTRGLNRAGHDFMLWNTDICGPKANREFQDLPETHPARDPKSVEFDPYYISIPFFYQLSMEGGAVRAAGSFIDNGHKGYFEFSQPNASRIQFCGGQYTEYVLAGPSLKSVLEGYTFLTGRMQAPPLWALGYHQCRWHAYDQARFLKLGDEFRRRKIPCDVMWMDIDYMDGYRVFTWNRKRFPNARGMLGTLRRKGFRTITIIDPGVKVDPGYAVYDDGLKKDVFCRTESGRVFRGKVWPGMTAFPDFAKRETRAWWGRLNAAHVKSGLAGIWNDMNEPVTFGGDWMDMMFERDGKLCPHDAIHNQYALLMAMGTVEGLRAAMPRLRTFVLSRAGYSGIQRYAANWMGDNCSRWEHLAMSIPMAMGLGLSGQPFVGADVGGFAEASGPELLARWTQYGALTPFFRNHNCDAQDQYPWTFGTAVESICRKAIELRYRLMPYVYSTFIGASETGDPIQRPLIYDFQDDRTVVNLDDEYLFGPSLLVAPVTAAGVTQRQVYLPAGTWYDLHTLGAHTGPRFVTAAAPMDRIPVFVRGGHVIPMLAEAPQSTMGLRPRSLDLHVLVPREDGRFESMLHEDDGATFAFQRGAFLRTRFELVRTGSRVRLTARVTGKGYPEFARREFRVLFHVVQPAVARVGGATVVFSDGSLVLPNRGEGFALSAKV